ncbi:MAG: dihydrolipoyl dehydrogenase [Candidatus Bipolaricaulota bacterium]
MKCYDDVLIGSGSGKKVIEASLEKDPGAEVAVIEKDRRGGICLNRGCRPTKILLSSADAVRAVERASSFGVDASIDRKDSSAVMERMRANQKEARSEINREFFARPNVHYYQGTARFTGPRTVKVNGQTEISGGRFFLCAGSEPVVPPIDGLDETPYLTSKEALALKELPDSLAVIGGGYIAAEMGYFFASMDTEVTIFGRNEQFVPSEEPEISYVVGRDQEKVLDLHRGYEVTQTEELEDGLLEIVARNGETGEVKSVRAGEVLVATGRGPINDLMNPEKAGVELDGRGWIEVDSHLRTAQDHIWAMGDCTGGYLFKHVSDYEADIVVENAVLGRDVEADYRAVPHAIFTDPEVAAVGLGEAEAAEKYGRENIVIGFSRFDETVKGQAIGARNGFVKVISTRGGEVLGGHIVGANASILIQEIVLAMEADRGVDDLAFSIHVHPALSKVIKKACRERLSPEEYHHALDGFLPGFDSSV